MARIFLSSTFEDLRQYRAAAVEALRRLNHDVIAMEEYLARDVRPQERTLAHLAASDLYIGIVGWRYGHIPPEDNPDQRSITEIEYRHAQRLGKSILIFLVDEQAPWPRLSIDREHHDRIKRFRDELSHDRAVSFFSSVDEFASQLTTAVGLWQRQRERAMRPRVLSLEELPLAWRLVVDFKGEPDLLRHVDAGMFAAALEKWEDETGSDSTRPWSSRLETALKALEAKQSPNAPSELWLAWMRATRGPELIAVAEVAADSEDAR